MFEMCIRYGKNIWLLLRSLVPVAGHYSSTTDVDVFSINLWFHRKRFFVCSFWVIILFVLNDHLVFSISVCKEVVVFVMWNCKLVLM